ncbi:MazG nucleotide pyrophosphohydrolase domain-containing protein [Pontibacterium granulatum]|uniref:MazG nucleotide pyrophosphohydrolase domain-containing protein n=1 Tax=Pontibacterium granulatum TaxID=2036029 RepID=UPI00249A3254|nr:MazG nucleotide pyrophosphohydrolase domain-containing protein [Pontibacterium granulatum]MDI3325875.1 MazG nucleotide pyrophosphohydrolase domain-containing protein [Pontibacterium granulatum]
MNPKHLIELLALTKAKSLIDQESGWATGAETYLDALAEEIGEVKDELYSSRACSLEDELADLLWNYLNALQILENQQKISIGHVFERASTKYRQRIEGIQAGQLWVDIKEQQKQQLAQEHRDTLFRASKND